MMRVALCVTIAVGSVGVGSATAATEQPLAVRAKQIIAARMIDPESVRLDPVKVVRATIDGNPQTILCGAYNAKNRFGGYVGAKAFAYDPTITKGVVTIELDFFSEDGAHDFNHDTEPAIRAGATVEQLHAQTQIVLQIAKTFLTACLRGEQ